MTIGNEEMDSLSFCDQSRSNPPLFLVNIAILHLLLQSKLPGVHCKSTRRDGSVRSLKLYCLVTQDMSRNH